MAALRGDQALMRGLLDSGEVLAGFLLILRGLLRPRRAHLAAAAARVGRPFEPQPVLVGR